MEGLRKSCLARGLRGRNCWAVLGFIVSFMATLRRNVSQKICILNNPGTFIGNTNLVTADIFLPAVVTGEVKVKFAIEIQ